MKIRKDSVYFLICFISTLLAGPVSVPAARAAAQPEVASRLLLIFDTSSAMKKRLPFEEKAVGGLFAITFNGKFHPGDTIGVWTFSKDLHTGQFPLERWEPEDAMTIPTDITAFLKVQHFSKSTSFDELVPLLNRVVSDSSRLTVIIFCDGEGQIKGTPADDTINGLFKQHVHDMEKARMPFVIVIRSQFGKYVGCTVSSAASINLPQFPPLPEALTDQATSLPKPAPQSPPPPPPAPLAPLIVIGRTVTTNLPTEASPPPVQQHAPAPVPQIAPPLPATPVPAALTPPMADTPAKTNQPPAATISTPATPAATAVAASPTADTEVPAPTSATEAAVTAASGKGKLFIPGVGILILMVAAVLGWFISRLFRRQDSPSLITESLKKR